MTDVPSPCVGVCKLIKSGPDRVCAGCYRTSFDIQAWQTYNNEMKRKALQTAMFRRWMHEADPAEFL